MFYNKLLEKCATVPLTSCLPAVGCVGTGKGEHQLTARGRATKQIASCSANPTTAATNRKSHFATLVRIDCGMYCNSLQRDTVSLCGGGRARGERFA